MASFVSSSITAAGEAAIARTLSGETLTFTKIVLGDGRMPAGSTPAGMTALVGPQAVVDIVKCEPETDGTAVVGGVFVNTGTATGFEWRELGLFANVGDGEFLFSYANAGDFCEFIPASGGGTVVEKVIDVFTYVGDKANVAIQIRADSYATVEQYLALKEKIDAGATAAAAAASAAAAAADRASEAGASALAVVERAESGEEARQVAEELRLAKFAEIEQRSRGWTFHYCGEGEYDPVTRRPTVADPVAATMYMVPSSGPSSMDSASAQQRALEAAAQTYELPDEEPGGEGADGDAGEVPDDRPSMWDEWMWDAPRGRWEFLGTMNATVSPITGEQIAAIVGGEDDGEGGTEALTRWGLRFFWQLIKDLFAPKKHGHSGADIEDGTVTAAKLASGAVTQAKIADGSVSLAKCDTALRDSVSRAGTSSSTVQWARLGNLVVIAGRCVVATASTVTVMTLPAGSRPAVHAESPTVTGGYAGANVDGTVVVAAKPGNNFFTLCFPAA